MRLRALAIFAALCLLALLCIGPAHSVPNGAPMLFTPCPLMPQNLPVPQKENDT